MVRQGLKTAYSMLAAGSMQLLSADSFIRVDDALRVGSAIVPARREYISV